MPLISRGILKHPLYRALFKALGIEPNISESLDIQRVSSSSQSLWQYLPISPSIPLRKANVSIWSFNHPKDIDGWTEFKVNQDGDALQLIDIRGGAARSSTGDDTYQSTTAYQTTQQMTGIDIDQDIWFEAQIRINDASHNGILATNALVFMGIAEPIATAGDLWDNDTDKVGINFQDADSEKLPLFFTLHNNGDTVVSENLWLLGEEIFPGAQRPDNNEWFTTGFHYNSKDNTFEYFFNGVAVGFESPAVGDWESITDNPMSISFGVRQDNLKANVTMDIGWIKVINDDPYDAP